MPRLILMDGNPYLGATSDADVKVFVDMLLAAVGDSDGVDIRWEK